MGMLPVAGGMGSELLLSERTASDEFNAFLSSMDEDDNMASRVTVVLILSLRG